jgi:hypothetical protein
MKQNQYNIGREAKVSLTQVSLHCNMSPYLRLVKNTIKDGGGFVTLESVNDETGMAEVSSGSPIGRLFSVSIPLNSLIF